MHAAITRFWFTPTIVTRRLFKWFSKGYIVLLQVRKAMKAGEVPTPLVVGHALATCK